MGEMWEKIAGIMMCWIRRTTYDTCNRQIGEFGITVSESSLDGSMLRKQRTVFLYSTREMTVFRMRFLSIGSEAMAYSSSAERMAGSWRRMHSSTDRVLCSSSLSACVAAAISASFALRRSTKVCAS